MTTSNRVFKFRQGEWVLGHKTYILGILNVTPDSFSDGSPANGDPAVQVARAERLLADGADGLDLGAESTRPGHRPISEEEEWARLGPVLKAVRAAFPRVPLSVDTSKRVVAERSLSEGCDIINDIWGLSRDPGIAVLAGQAKAGLILMFNADEDPRTPVAIPEMRNFFVSALARADEAGVDTEHVLIDPGIGFRVQGDSIWHTLTHLSQFSQLGSGILIGHSRKRFVGTVAEVPAAAERDLATAVISAFVGVSGADVVRVHDARSTRQALAVAYRWRMARGDY
ncbi:MAG: dihydropteroate synthase [Sulfobacillus acidophilus]|uniref:Dihydropteroate synthase n=1 Tax=Sulfobacillus acidophilus TaxID=53633 RepID=A0A2T2WGG6_9FIRM|nr:MAG: dihydropteroate synthase [Sulfobacillus acidophilus]